MFKTFLASLLVCAMCATGSAAEARPGRPGTAFRGNDGRPDALKVAQVRRISHPGFAAGQCTFGIRDPGILAEEDRAGREATIQHETEFFADGTQERFGELDEQAAAIAGLAVRGDCTTVGQSRQRRNRRFDDPVVRQVVEIGDETEAATISMQPRVKQ